MNLETGARVFCAPGRSADTLLPFWPKVQTAGARIEAVAIDMGPAYIAAVQEYLPNAVIVFDHFHVIKLFNDKLSDLRRELHRDLTERQHVDVWKGTRWLLLKNPENLNPAKDEPKFSRRSLFTTLAVCLRYSATASKCGSMRAKIITRGFSLEVPSPQVRGDDELHRRADIAPFREIQTRQRACDARADRLGFSSTAYVFANSPTSHPPLLLPRG